VKLDAYTQTNRGKLAFAIEEYGGDDDVKEEEDEEEENCY